MCNDDRYGKTGAVVGFIDRPPGRKSADGGHEGRPANDVTTPNKRTRRFSQRNLLESSRGKTLAIFKINDEKMASLAILILWHLNDANPSDGLAFVGWGIKLWARLSGQKGGDGWTRQK